MVFFDKVLLHLFADRADQVTFRGCWGPWENMTEPRDEGCFELGKETETCFCKHGQKACNSDTSLTASVLEIIAGTLFSFLVFIY